MAVKIATEEDLENIRIITELHPTTLMQYPADRKKMQSLLQNFIVYKNEGYLHYGKRKHSGVHICQLAAKYYRRGIGARLIRYLQARYDFITVDCSVKNETAMLFYKRLGFKIIQERKFFNKHVRRHSVFNRCRWEKAKDE